MEFPALSDYAELMNGLRDGWVSAMGIRYTRATADEVQVECEVQRCHLQAYGLVHGGLYAGIAESLASVGAALYALPRGWSVVGLENTTSFLRAVRKGRLLGVGRPLYRGRRTQVWEVNITDEEGRLAASGRVRLLCLEPGAVIAGEEVGVPAPQQTGEPQGDR